MTVFKTNHGNVSVKNWAYQLQGNNGTAHNIAPLASSSHDLVVIDRSRDGSDATLHTAAQISAIKNKTGGAVAVAYVTIGEASDFRDDWNPKWTSNGLATGANTSSAPSWLGPINSDWPNNRKVRYWEKQWQDTVFNDQKTGSLDKIIAQGFDAAYLDIVDAYYFWAEEVPASQRKSTDPKSEKDAAVRMIDFIVKMTAHARETNPDFFVIPQNGGFIIDALAGSNATRKTAFLDAIGAIGVEDVYLRDGEKDENNGFLPDEDLIATLKRDFIDNGKAVFAVDYVNDTFLMGKFIAQALGDGFIPCVARSRELDTATAPVSRASGADDRSNIIAGTGKADIIDAKQGTDIVFGFGGNDRLKGGSGTDSLLGGQGRDLLYGGEGKDTFDYNLISESGASSTTRDAIIDFKRGTDKIDLRTIDANTKSSGNQTFEWLGNKAFTQDQGELRYSKTSTGIIISGDVNGDGKADFQIYVKNLTYLNSSDFLL